jgi:fructokinase
MELESKTTGPEGLRIGIDLGGTKIEGIVLNASGIECGRRRVPAPRGDYALTISAIVALVADLERQAGLDRSIEQSTIGVGIPGIVSPRTGLVKNANSVWLIGHPLDRDLAAALGRPVRLENDANCFAVSEATDGTAAGADPVFGVILGTGVGGGIVVGGRIVTGANAIAGEWGHNPLPWPSDDERPGAPCYCGRRGCIETFLSGPGLARDHRERTGRAMTPEAIAAAAGAGDADAEGSLRRYEDRLARSLAHAINLVDPEVIVLGGGLCNMRRFYDNVPPLLQRYCFSDGITTRILPPKHGDASGVRGAAWLWPPATATSSLA